jgi:hypothetical protein
LHFQAVCAEFLIRYPDLIFAPALPTVSDATFELGILAATSREHEIDIDREIEKRSKRIDFAAPEHSAEGRPTVIDGSNPDGRAEQKSSTRNIEKRSRNVAQPRRPMSLAIPSNSPLLSEVIDEKLIDEKLFDKKLIDTKLIDTKLSNEKRIDKKSIDEKLSDRKLIDEKLFDKKWIDVGGGPAALPPRYHTEVKLRRAKSSTLATSCVEQKRSSVFVDQKFVQQSRSASDLRHRGAGLPDFSWYTIPKPEKMYQMNTKYSKFP